MTVLIAEDDPGQAKLIEKNLRRGGLENDILVFRDGQAILDFLLRAGGGGPDRREGESYVLLLDIRMPKVDGVEVLRRIKRDAKLRKLPVVMLTTTDDPLEVERCHALGCNLYLTKPVGYERFQDAIQKLAAFLGVVEIPGIGDGPPQAESQE